MTVQRPGQPARQPGNGWRAGAPELAITVVLLVAVTGAAYAWAGIDAATLVAACWAILALAFLRLLPDAGLHRHASAEDWTEPGQTSIAGFWRKRGMVKDATANMASYEHELRLTLQHLLAARLAERHGVSLYDEPDAARRILLAGTRDKKLWYWLDPERAAAPDQGRAGIPPRTLAAILDRLEHL